MPSPAQDAAFLLGESPAIAGGATGWRLGVGALTPDPHQQVVILDAPGSNPNPKWLLDFPSIQVIVRGNPDDYDAAYTKIKAIKDRLLGRTSGHVGTPPVDPAPEYRNWWTSVTGLGDIIPLGQDDKSRFLFSVNYRIILEPATGTNREPL